MKDIDEIIAQTETAEEKVKLYEKDCKSAQIIAALTAIMGTMIWGYGELIYDQLEKLIN